MTRRPPICVYCQHLNADKNATKLTCRAFPAGIPESILDNQADHRQPIPGDHSLTFAPSSAKGRVYAEEVFTTQPQAEPIAA
jgi:hypothetical protein